MTTKYKTGWGASKIEEVEVERETDSSVWINGRRRSKLGESERYFDTWERAHVYLLSRAEQKARSCQRSLEQAEQEYENVKDMINDRKKEMTINES